MFVDYKLPVNEGVKRSHLASSNVLHSVHDGAELHPDKIK